MAVCGQMLSYSVQAPSMCQSEGRCAEKSEYMPMSKAAASSRDSNDTPPTQTSRGRRRTVEFKMVPDQVDCQGSTTVVLLFSQDIISHQLVSVSLADTQQQQQQTVDILATRINERSFSFTAPSREEGVVKVTVYVDGETTNKARTLKYVVSPTLLLARGLSGLYLRQLDALCSHIIGARAQQQQQQQRQQRHGASSGSSISDVDRLLTGSLDAAGGDGNEVALVELFSIYMHASPTDLVNVKSRTPTLLHLAASHGLTTLCSRLSTFPHSALATSITNERGLSAVELARYEGQYSTAAILESRASATATAGVCGGDAGSAEKKSSDVADKVNTNPVKLHNDRLHQRPKTLYPAAAAAAVAAAMDSDYDVPPPRLTCATYGDYDVPPTPVATETAGDYDVPPPPVATATTGNSSKHGGKTYISLVHSPGVATADSGAPSGGFNDDGEEDDVPRFRAPPPPPPSAANTPQQVIAPAQLRRHPEGLPGAPAPPPPCAVQVPLDVVPPPPAPTCRVPSRCTDAVLYDTPRPHSSGSNRSNSSCSSTSPRSTMNNNNNNTNNDPDYDVPRSDTYDVPPSHPAPVVPTRSVNPGPTCSDHSPRLPPPAPPTRREPPAPPPQMRPAAAAAQTPQPPSCAVAAAAVRPESEPGPPPVAVRRDILIRGQISLPKAKSVPSIAAAGGPRPDRRFVPVPPTPVSDDVARQLSRPVPPVPNGGPCAAARRGR